MSNPFRRPIKTKEPATLRAEARLSAELEPLPNNVRLERLSLAINAGEIDQDAFVRIMRYLAHVDLETRADEA